MKLIVALTFSVFLCFLSPMADVTAAVPTYWQDVRPVLRKHCTVCHSNRNLTEIDVSGGLALDSFEAITKNAKKPLLQKGRSGDSLIIKLITMDNADKRMPLGGKELSEDVIALLRRWIDSGAKEGVQPRAETAVITPSKRKAHRKLDVALVTSAQPPAGLFGSAAAAPLQFVLREGPLPPAVAVAFSSDGNLLATGAYGHAAVWDLNTGRPLKILTNVLAAVNDLKFSPDGKTLAVAGGQPSAKGDLRLFSVGDWKLKATLGGHEDVVACVAFSPDGKHLASASFDRTVRVWDLANFKVERIHTGHSDFVYSVAFSPDGQLLASAGKDRTVKLVEAFTGKSRLTFSGMNQEVLAVAYSPDGQFVVSSGFESKIYWWNPKNAERGKQTSGQRGATTELCFSRDGKLLVSTGMDGVMNIWNGGTGTAVQSFTIGSSSYAVAISGDGKRVAVGGADGLVRVYSMEGNRLAATLVTIVSHAADPQWIVVTPEGYAAASDKAQQSIEWRMSGKAVPAAIAWKALGKSEYVLQSLAGKTPPAPIFGK